MINKKTIIRISLLIFIVAVVSVIVWTIFGSKKVENPTTATVVSTTTSVILATPKTNEATLHGAIGETVQGLDLTILPTKVVEDSRCPLGVQCIQAGTVRVQTTLVSGLGTSTPIFTLGRSITTEAETVTLVEVTPVPSAGKVTKLSEYRFTWKVSKR